MTKLERITTRRCKQVGMWRDRIRAAFPEGSKDAEEALQNLTDMALIAVLGVEFAHQVGDLKPKELL